MKAKEVMTPNVEFVESNVSVVQAAKKMKALNVGCVPILFENKPVGMLTDRDIIIRAVAEGFDLSEPVVGIMSEVAITCKEDDDIKDVAQLMEDKQIRRLIVTDRKGKMTGIVSLGDLAVNIEEELAGEVLRKVSEPSKPER